jgi:hypothetical protein
MWAFGGFPTQVFLLYFVVEQSPCVESSFLPSGLYQISFFDDFHSNGAYLLSY